MSQTKSAPRMGNHHGHSAAIPASSQTQKFGVIQKNPVALETPIASASIDDLNQILVDTMTLRDLYKKHHWQAAGPVFYMIHLLFDKHFEEQSGLVDLVAERIQTLGGLAIAMAPDVAEATKIPRPPKGREDVSTQIGRLLQAHGIIIREARKMAKDADDRGDDATNDMLVSNILRTNELQAWFIDQHIR